MSISSSISLLQKNLSRVIIGKEDSIQLMVVALLAGGHILLEDVPGLGKTLLARSLAKSIAARFRRIQCTPDLLPSDVTGVSIYNESTRQFEFNPGPVFSTILLVDEINRTTPRTQSSLLEAMAENQVSVDGKTYRLHAPYMVIATQNPIENHGTYPLPEAQLDRFLMRISLGYPSLENEVNIMQAQKSKQPLDSISAVIKPEEIAKLQMMTRKIHIEAEVATYIAKIVHATRQHKSLAFGSSPRGSLALMRTAQAMALLRKQQFVDPHTVKLIAKPVLAHRIAVKPQYMASQTAQGIIDEILDSIPVPVSRSAHQSPSNLPQQALANEPSTTSQATPHAASLSAQKPAETTDTGMELIDF